MKREYRNLAVFILPLVAFLALFILIPVVGTFYTSLWREVPFMSRVFVGFANYVRLLRDVQFWNSLLFTLLFAAVSVTVELVAGTAVALVINERFPMRSLFRGIALLPWAIPSIICARVWQLIYQYDSGIANHLLRQLLGTQVNWFGTAGAAFTSLVIADAWRTVPFVAIIILAGLQSVPEDLYKQARIDGAGMVQRLFRITLPAVKPVLIVALLFRTIDALRVFDIIYVITGGGPGGATASASLYGYRFFLLGDFGYGSAVSTALFIVALACALLYVKIGGFRKAALS